LCECKCNVNVRIAIQWYIKNLIYYSSINNIYQQIQNTTELNSKKRIRNLWKDFAILLYEDVECGNIEMIRMYRTYPFVNNNCKAIIK